jgi:capsid assembly protease
LARAVFNARQRKPVVASINPLGASAAYWVASQASQVIMPSSGEAGAIGVFALHVDASEAYRMAGLKPTVIQSDISPHKTETAPFAPLSDAAMAYEQQQINAIGREFVNDVGRGRNISTAIVAARFGGGRTLRGSAAVGVGMADSIGGLDAAFARTANPTRTHASRFMVGGKADATVAHKSDDSAASRRRRLELLRSG